ncbi:MAG: hypothetical protein ACKO1H_14445, partial [Tabrizicola sp.]
TASARNSRLARRWGHCRHNSVLVSKHRSDFLRLLINGVEMVSDGAMFLCGKVGHKSGFLTPLHTSIVPESETVNFPLK